MVACAFPEPAHPQGAATPLHTSHSLDLRGQALGNPRRNKERDSHWLTELRKVDAVCLDGQGYLDETNDAAFRSRVPSEESFCLWEGRTASLQVGSVAFPTHRTLLRVAFQFLFQLHL